MDNFSTSQYTIVSFYGIVIVMHNPWKIGHVQIRNKVLIAPLAGISDIVFRELMVKAGAGLVYTEMISTAGLSRRDKKTFKLLALSKREHPVAIQIFGNKPEEFSRSIEIINNEIPADIIDINMGCPVRKVVHSGSGSALMKNLNLAKEIIQATVGKAACPVTVKFRTGWDSTSLSFLELGKICQEEGVAAVALHGRTRAQAYSGKADWSKIAELKAALKIPVIGNGDVHTLTDAVAIMQETKADAVMLARGCIGNPWLVQSILKNSEITPTPAERIATYLQHTRLFVASYPERSEKALLCEMRKFAHRYISGFSGSSAIRQRINQICTMEELESYILTLNTLHA